MEDLPNLGLYCFVESSRDGYWLNIAEQAFKDGFATVEGKHIYLSSNELLYNNSPQQLANCIMCKAAYPTSKVDETRISHG